MSLITREQHEVAVSKRGAKATAVQLTGRPVKVSEKLGHCIIDVRFPDRHLRFVGATWWLALRKLFGYLEEEKNLNAAVESMRAGAKRNVFQRLLDRVRCILK